MEDSNFYLEVFIVGFVFTIVLDAYFIDNRPREAQPAKGRVYPKYLKSSYGATVYLTDKEKMLSDWLFPLSFVIVAHEFLSKLQWSPSLHDSVGFMAVKQTSGDLIKEPHHRNQRISRGEGLKGRFFNGRPFGFQLAQPPRLLFLTGSAFHFATFK